MNLIGDSIVFRQRVSQDEYTLKGIFDAGFEEVDPNTQEIISSNALQLGIQGSDLPVEPEAGDYFIINGKTYRILDIMEDGQGGLKFPLNEVPNA